MSAGRRRRSIGSAMPLSLQLAAAIAIVFLIGAFGGIWERIGDPWRLIVLAVAIFFLVKAALAAPKDPA